MKGCHTGLFWNEVLPHISKGNRVPIAKFYDGYRFGVDMNSWLLGDPIFYSEAVAAIAMNRTSYTPHILMNAIRLRHERLCESFIAPVYVLPGAVNPKEVFTDDEIRMRASIQAFIEEAQRQPIKSKERRNQMKVNLRRSRVIDPGLIAFLGDWMRSEGNMEVINAPFETTWQLLDLERNFDTQGSISEDGTLVMSGARLVLFGINYAPKGIEVRVFDRYKAIDAPNVRYKLNEHFLPEAATLYGTRYWIRTKHSASEALRLHWPKLVASKQRGDASTNHAFDIAVNQLRYGPVARVDNDAICNVEPLDTLPDDSVAWSDVIGFDPHGTLAIPKEDYSKARLFEEGHCFAKSSPKIWFSGLTCEYTEDMNAEEVEEEKEDIIW